MRALALAISICAALSGLSGAERLDEAARDERPISDRDRDHWSYHPLRDAFPTSVTGADRNVIDAFVRARLETRELRALPEADRYTLIRRVTFDLTGLPPTPDEIREFVEDRSPDAYERLLDRLFASPAYGERRGQHWLDLARFAETDGFEHDKVRPQAWRYRDWVIDAINRDMPWDEFVRVQIAGDRLRPGDPGAAIATGFALCGPDMPDINSQDERLHTVLNEMTSAVGSVFLGLRVQCAQCHDHKSDPISQADFYRLRAFFGSADLFRDHPIGKGEGGKKALLGRVLKEAEARRPMHLMVRGDFRNPGPRVAPAIPRIVDEGDHRLVLEEDDDPRSALARWISSAENALALRVTANRIWQRLFGRGLVRTPSDFGILGDTPSHPDLLDRLALELPRVEWSVKRLQRLIVRSATYRRASRGDASAGGNVEEGGEGTVGAGTLTADDPDNRFLARQNRKRLDAEAIRDAILAVAGRLSTRRGGPGVMPPLPAEIRKSIRRDHWKVSPDVEDHHRRSIYLFVRRNLRYPFFEVFDRPDTNFSCARRNETTIAPQSLAMLNSDLSVEAARYFAGRAVAVAGDDSARVAFVWRAAFGRDPTAREIEFARSLLDSLTRELEGEARGPADLATPLPSAGGQATLSPCRGAALTSLCLALLNANEFIYVD